MAETYKIFENFHSKINDCDNLNQSLREIQNKSKKSIAGNDEHINKQVIKKIKKNKQKFKG